MAESTCQVPYVVPKNPPKWPERFLEWCVKEGGVPNEGQMEVAKEVWLTTTRDHWATFQSRGKQRKEKAKKEKGESVKAEESETSVKARGALVKLHRKLTTMVEAGEYDNIKPIVDKIGLVAKALNNTDDEE
jgi:hypothetical protein